MANTQEIEDLGSLVNIYAQHGDGHEDKININEVDPSSINKLLFENLIYSSFGKALVGDYFENNDIAKAYVESEYGASAILLDYSGSLYLDKFAVDKSYWGTNMSEELFNTVISFNYESIEENGLFWRVKEDNHRAHRFYNKVTAPYGDDLSLKTKDIPGWKIYHLGGDYDQIFNKLDYAKNKEETLVIE